MKVTRSKLKQIIKEELSKALNEADEPGLTIFPGNVQVPDDVATSRAEAAVQNIIDDYSRRSAKPELIKQVLEAVTKFGPLDQHDLNLIDIALENIRRVAGPGQGDR